jgi:hypothetical protein
MQSIILEHIKGEDLTKRLTEVLEFDPAGTYRVTVQIEDEELASAASLPELAEILSKRAQSRGLTPELLALWELPWNRLQNLLLVPLSR